MIQKRAFKTIFIFFAILLVILPFLVSFNELLTKVVEKFFLYVWIQNIIVPVQVKFVTVLLSPFNLDLVSYQDGFSIKGTYLQMTWNCLGWQSILLLGITLVVGFVNSRFTWASKIETIAIGILGTFLVNVVRLTFIILLFNYLRPIYAYVYHDYLAAVVTIIWLFIFWWFVSRFVLQSRPE